LRNAASSIRGKVLSAAPNSSGPPQVVKRAIDRAKPERQFRVRNEVAEVLTAGVRFCNPDLVQKELQIRQTETGHVRSSSVCCAFTQPVCAIRSTGARRCQETVRNGGKIMCGEQNANRTKTVFCASAAAITVSVFLLRRRVGIVQGRRQDGVATPCAHAVCREDRSAACQA
jgi:hypothetical protein